MHNPGNNILPANRITQTARLITSYYPAPRVPGNPDGTSNYPDPNQPDPNNYYAHTARIDHSIGSANRMYGRLTVTKNLEKGAENLTRNIASGWDIIRRNKSLALDDVHMFSPNAVLNVRLGLNRFHEDNVPLSTGIDLTTLGFSSALNNAIDPRMRAFPRIVVDAYDDLGNYNPSYKLTDMRSLQGSLTVLRGRHTMQVGADLQVYRRNYQIAGQASPQLNFFQNYTNGPYNTSGVASVGQGLASLLLGISTGGYVLVNDTGATQDISHSVYVQDNWKLSTRLTVTLGLRYEFTGPVTDRYNRTTINYNYSVASPINDAVRANYAKNPIPERPLSDFQLIGGPQFAGVNGLPRTLYDASRRGLAPRIGVTYGITPKTVLRAGYGIFLVPLGLRAFDVTLTGFAATTVFAQTDDNGLTFRVRDFGDAFADGTRRPVGSSLGLATNLGDGVVDIARRQPIPYMQRWQFGLQREFPKRVLVDVAYVGNRGTRLRISRNLDALPNQWLSKSTTRDQNTINFLAQTFPNPFYGVVPATSSLGATTVISRSSLLVPYPQYTGLTKSDAQGFSWYHSLQAKIERRFANGFTVQGAYSYSKLMQATELLNPADPYPYRTISDMDFPQRLGTSAIYELPFGAGRRWLGAQKGALGRVVEGWQVQGIYTAQTGQALTFGNIIFNGDIKTVPLPNDQRTVQQWFNVNAGFNRKSKEQLASNLMFSNNRWSGVRGDGTNLLTVSAIKNTRINERMQLQLRGEAINVVNHPMFTNPNIKVTSSAFGTVTKEKGSPRTLQLMLKLLF